MQITVNGSPIETDAESLKVALERENFLFPCGGKGLCGKCRIVAPSIPASERDKTFLSPQDLAAGVRLACDKRVVRGLNLTTEMQRAKLAKKLRECDILAILGNETILIGILSDGELVDSVAIERQSGASADAKQRTKAVRSIVAHESIEFFERYGVAKAGTVFVFGTDAMLFALSDGTEIPSEPQNAAFYELPAEEIVFAPGKNSIDFIKNYEMPEKTLVERAVRFATDVRFRNRMQ